MILRRLVGWIRRASEHKPSPPRKTAVLVVPTPDIFEPGFDSSALAMSDSIVVHKTGPGGEAIRTNDWGAGEIAVDEKPGGVVRSSTRAAPKQGEDDTLLVGRALVRRLNEEGANWSTPEQVIDDSDVDCVARQDDALLEIQVKRIAEEEFWRSLRRHGLVAGDETMQAMADTLRARVGAIAKRYAPSRRGRVTLALNARQTPQYAFEAVARSFRERHGEWARGLGFAGIWVVGPSPELTRRLDS